MTRTAHLKVAQVFDDALRKLAAAGGEYGPGESPVHAVVLDEHPAWAMTVHLRDRALLALVGGDYRRQAELIGALGEPGEDVRSTLVALEAKWGAYSDLAAEWNREALYDTHLGSDIKPSIKVAGVAVFVYVIATMQGPVLVVSPHFDEADDRLLVDGEVPMVVKGGAGEVVWSTAVSDPDRIVGRA